MINYTKWITIMMTDKDALILTAMEKELGMKRSDIVRHRLFGSAKRTLINNHKLLAALDATGKELACCHQDIHTLAAQLRAEGVQPLAPDALTNEFNSLMASYELSRQKLEKQFRRLIRLMKIYDVCKNPR